MSGWISSWPMGRFLITFVVFGAIRQGAGLDGAPSGTPQVRQPMPRALVVSHALDHTGVPIACVQLSHVLAASGWHVHILAFRGGDLVEIANRTFPVTILENQPWELIHPQDYDIIFTASVVLDMQMHMTWFWMRSQVEAFGLAFTSRLVWWIQESFPYYPADEVTRYLLACHIRYTVFVSEYAADLWYNTVMSAWRAHRSLLPGLGQAAALGFPVLYPLLSLGLMRLNDLSAEQLAARAARARMTWNLTANAYVVYSAGSLIHNKGPLELLQAVDMACEILLMQNGYDGAGPAPRAGNDSLCDKPGAPPVCASCPHLVYAYSVANVKPELEAFMQNSMRALPLAHVIMFHPHDQSMVWEMYSAADVFVMNSRCETLGMVTLEAMAQAVPVLATNSCGALDMVQHNVTGLLHSNWSSVRELADNLLSLHPRTEQGRSLGARLGGAGKARFMDKFSPVLQRLKLQVLFSRVVQSAMEYDMTGLWRDVASGARNVPSFMQLSHYAMKRIQVCIDQGPPKVNVSLTGPYSPYWEAHPRGNSTAQEASTTNHDHSDAGSPAGVEHLRRGVVLWRPPVTWAWQNHSRAPMSAVDALSAGVGQWLYVWGGSDLLGQRPNVTMWRMDMDVSSPDPSWRRIGTWSTGLASGHAAVAVHMERYIYVAGGQVDGECSRPINRAYRFDTQLEVWQALPSLPAPLYGASAVVVGDLLLVIGGAASRESSNTTWRYSHLQLDLPSDGSLPTGSWEVYSAMPQPAFKPAAVVMNLYKKQRTSNNTGGGHAPWGTGAHGEPSVRVFGGSLSIPGAVDEAARNFSCVERQHEETGALCGVRSWVWPGTWQVSDGALFPVGLSHMESCTLVLPGGDLVLFLGGMHERAWLSRVIYAYHAPTDTLTAVGEVPHGPHGRISGAVCGMWAGKIWMALGARTLFSCDGCSTVGELSSDVWSTPMPPELLT